MTPPAIESEHVVGKRLVRLLQTQWSDPVCHVEGLGDAYYCHVVLDLGDRLLEHDHDKLKEWSSTEKLVPVVEAEHRAEVPGSPVGATIATIAVDQFKHVYVLFNNGTFMAIDRDYGWYLWLGAADYLRALRTDGELLALRDWWSDDPV